MRSLSDQEFAETEMLLRQRLGQLAAHAPTTVHLPDEVPVVLTNRPTGRARRAGVIAAVTALIGAGGFTTYSFLGASNEGGSATPQEAVLTFVSAMEHEDVLGMIDVTVPEEVGALHAAVDSITSDAKRIDVLAHDFNSSGVQGVDISVADLVLDTNMLEGGLAAVTVTGGTVNTSFDGKAFPFGDKVRALLGDEGQPKTSATTFGQTNPLLVAMTVERAGRWYVSLEYTLAEYIRQLNGWEAPGPVTRTPVGFDTPEDAATGFYDRLATLDFQSVLDTFAPGEDAMAWLAQAWLADAQAAIERGRLYGWSVAISGLTYETVGEGDHLTLKPLTFKVEGTVPDDYSGNADPSLPTVVVSSNGSQYALVPPGQVPATATDLSFSTDFPGVNGDYNMTDANLDGTIAPLQFPQVGPLPFTVERADGCTTFTGSGALAIFGVGHTPGATAVDGGYKLCGDADLPGVISVLLLTGGLRDLPAVSVVQSSGKWYVSPLGTALASATVGLHDVKDGTSLFDSALAPFIYGGFGRGSLEAVAVGKPIDTFNPACLPALIVENGTVTGVAADPSPAAVRSCSETVSTITSSSGTSSSDSGGGSAPAVVEVPVSSVPVATTAP